MGRRGRPASGAPHDPCSHRRHPVPARLACRARLEDRRGRCGPLRGRDRRGRARAGADLTASLDELSERGGVRPGQRGHRSRRALRGRPRDHASRAARARGRRGGTGRRGLARDAVARDADRRGERQGADGTARRRSRRARPGRVGGHAPAAHGRRRPRAVPRSSAGDRPAVVSRRVPSPVNATPRLATPAELDTVARVFAEALAPDPMITWPFPPATTVDDVITLFQILLQHAYGSLGVIWVVGDERAEAAAAWLPPEQVSRFQEIEVATRPRIEALTDDGGGRYAVFWDWLGEHLPTEPCWFLDILAVRSAARGRGLASALVRHGRDRAHGAGQPAVLETGNPATLPMYEHLGFRVVERADAPDGGPTIWFLRA